MNCACCHGAFVREFHGSIYSKPIKVINAHPTDTRSPSLCSMAKPCETHQVLWGSLLLVFLQDSNRYLGWISVYDKAVEPAP